MLKKFLLFAIAVFSVSQLHASNYILKDTILDGFGAPAVDTIFIDSEIYIGPAGVLEIKPGTVVMARGHYRIQVYGCIWAVGTAQKPILFTAQDTINGWHGVRIYNPPYSADTSKLIYCTLEYGRAVDKGKIYDSSGDLLLIHATSKFKISHCTFRKGLVQSEYLFSSYTSSGTLYKCDFNGSNYSKGAFLDRNTNLISCRFQNCIRGVYSDAYNTTIYIDSCLFLNNHSNDDGGGLNCGGSNGAFVISNSSFIGNSSKRSGGGLYTSSDVKITNCLFKDNTSLKNGGGLDLNNSNILIINTLFINNTSGKGGGANIGTTQNYKFSITNCSFVNNASKEIGGGLYLAGKYISLYNNILSNNKALLGGRNLSFATSSSSTGTIQYNNIQYGQDSITGIYTGTYSDNIDADPMFADSNGVFRLRAGSPCIDAGTPDTTGLGLPMYDLLGLARICNNRVDMGAYEFQTGASVQNITLTKANDISVEEDFAVTPLLLNNVFAYPYGTAYLSFEVIQKGNTSQVFLKNDTLYIQNKPHAHGIDTLILKASDGLGAGAADTFLLTVASVNDAPVISSSVFTVTENPTSQTLLGTLQFSDFDPEQQHTLSFIPTLQPYITVDNSTLKMFPADTSLFNYELDDTIKVTIVITDNGANPLSDTAVLVFKLLNVNDKPVLTYKDTVEIFENPPLNTILDTIKVEDEENPDNVYLTLLSHTDVFELNNSVLSVYDTTQLDYEADSIWNLAIEVRDFNGTPKHLDTISIVIKLKDIVEVGINKIIGVNVSIFPNPFTNSLSIVSEDISFKQIRIINPLGNIVYSENTNKHLININTEHLLPGTYVVQMVTSQGTIERVMVK